LTESATDTPEISVVIPAYNERDSLVELVTELRAVLADRAFELILVDDGSNDGGERVMDELARQDARVRVLRLVRNAGKSAAYMVGFAASRGAIVVTLDADLQDDPHEIPAMLDGLQRHDLVVGWKQGRFENEPLKAAPSKVFNGLLSYAFGLRLHDANCGFRAMRRGVALGLELRGDLYRFIPQLAFSNGFRVGEQPVRHRRRKFGASKYGARRFWTGLLDLLTVRFLTRFTDKPLHFFGTLGLFPFLAGAGIEVYVLACKLAGDTFQEHVAAIIVGALMVIVGFQCIVSGLIGEMLAAKRAERLPLGS
jgi:glycosyltransferase involved in cell wall biosynthesis